MSYQEKDFQSSFRRYAKNRMSERTFVYELKVTKGDYINFSRLEDHQEYALRASSGGIAHHKLPDEGISQKPYDGFQVTGVPAFVGVLFNKEEQQKEFFLIPISDWRAAREEVDRKSLTRDKAAEIGERHELA